MKKIIVKIFTGIVLLSSNLTIAQAPINTEGVSISATVAPPHPSAMLDVQSSSKGMLIPRMTSAQKFGVSNPAEGLLVYQTDEISGFYFWNGAAWQCMSCCVSASEDWKVIGSSDVLLTGVQVPGFSSCFQAVGTPSSGSQKLSIRKINGMIEIKGEFELRCTLTEGQSYPSLFLPAGLPTGYAIASGGTLTVNERRIDGVVLAPSSTELVYHPSSAISVGVYPTGTIFYIDVTFPAE